MRSTVHEHLVSGVEASVRTLAALPLAVIQIVEADRAVRHADVVGQLIQ